MTGQTFITGRDSRSLMAFLASAPPGMVVTVRKPARTLDQNELMWALLGRISRAKPEGRHHTPDVWKAIFMNACGYAVQFEQGLSGEPFPLGYRSSKLTKEQMSELIDFIYAQAAAWGVEVDNPDEAAA